MLNILKKFLANNINVNTAHKYKKGSSENQQLIMQINVHKNEYKNTKYHPSSTKE